MHFLEPMIILGVMDIVGLSSNPDIVAWPLEIWISNYTSKEGKPAEFVFLTNTVSGERKVFFRVVVLDSLDTVPLVSASTIGFWKRKPEPRREVYHQPTEDRQFALEALL